MLVLHMSDAVAETMIQFIVTYLQSPAMLPAADPDTDEPPQVDQGLFPLHLTLPCITKSTRNAGAQSVSRRLLRRL